MVDVAGSLIKVHETGRWAHINVKLLHSFSFLTLCTIFIGSVSTAEAVMSYENCPDDERVSPAFFCSVVLSVINV